jgi:hypothetical protein
MTQDNWLFVLAGILIGTGGFGMIDAVWGVDRTRV